MDNIYKDRFRDEWLKEYPRFVEEVNIPRERRGHIAFMRDHLIDLQLFEESKAPNGTTLDPDVLPLMNLERV